MPENGPIFEIEIKFYRGVKEIAEFLNQGIKTTYKHLSQGKLPAKKDRTGRWVMTNKDYYESLKRKERRHGSHG
jgi:predicted site-specific integrase-resolvase